jgi:hypothetical protein
MIYRTPLLISVILIAIIFLFGFIYPQPLTTTALVLSKWERFSQEISLQELNDLQKLKLLNAWLYTSLKIRDPQNTSDLKKGILEQLTGSCGPRDVLIGDFFKEASINHRQVNFYGIPGMVGHSATEVFINEDWRFVDATFGLYFALPEDPETPISLETARLSYPNIIVMKTVDKGWSGEWRDISTLAEQLDNKTLYAKDETLNIFYPSKPDLLAGYIEQTYITSVNAKLSPQDTLSIAIPISLKSDATGQIGALDEDLSDLTPFFLQVGRHKVYAPYCYVLGLFGSKGPIVEKEFNFITDRVRNLKLTLHFLKDIPSSQRKYFLTQTQSPAVKQTQFFSSENYQWANRSLTLKIKVDPPSTRVKIFLSRGFATEHSYSLDGITWESLPVK